MSCRQGSHWSSDVGNTSLTRNSVQWHRRCIKNSCTVDGLYVWCITSQSYSVSYKKNYNDAMTITGSSKNKPTPSLMLLCVPIIHLWLQHVAVIQSPTSFECMACGLYPNTFSFSSALFWCLYTLTNQFWGHYISLCSWLKLLVCVTKSIYCDVYISVQRTTLQCGLQYKCEDYGRVI